MRIVKIGGGGSINLEGIADDLAGLEERLLVVHGANALRDRLGADLGWEKRTLTSVSGYTSVFSDDAAIDLQMMAYAGLRNKRIVETLQRRGVDAVGLTGLDGRAVQGERNRGIRVREGGKLRIVRDLSGKPRSVNRALLDALLDRECVPVLTVPIADQEGFAINSENDDIVAVLQAEYRAETVVQLIEAPGFLEDAAAPGSLVAEMSPAALARREQEAEGRMRRKLLALRRLFEGGAATVVIADGRAEHPVRDALEGKGTTIR
jgi:acetylglutamate/LysW-gamma-L-alpha-aminoadipate kinase